MFEYKAQTDEIIKIQLPSFIQQVMWNKRRAAPGGVVLLQVFTHFAGNNSELEIELTDHSGKTFGKYKDKISGNRYWVKVKVPDGAKDALYATVKLPKHALEQKSNPLVILPKVEITNVKWDKNEARRGDILKLTADVKGVPDSTEAKIEIWEYDDDQAHDLITQFPAEIKNGKIEMEWEYEYHEDTDDIPTEEEAEKGYNPPEYFFTVTVGGVEGKSELLEFKDWIELELLDQSNRPIAGVKYIILFADGTEKEGTLDENGFAKIENIIPGPFTVQYPDYEV